MKEWTLPIRIILQVLSYLISLMLFINTSAFDYANFKTSFVTVNLLAAIIIGIGYASSRNTGSLVFFVCMGLCVPSLMAYSKLGKSIFEINVDNNFSAFLTAVFFITIILMLLSADKLKKLEKEQDSLIANGADEDEVKNITINGLKVYSVFIAGIFILAIIAATVGVFTLRFKGSTLVAILTAIAGIALFSGCIYFLLRKWTNPPNN